MSDLHGTATQRFGRLIVIGRAEDSAGGGIRLLCRCECGTERAVFASNLRKGHTLSCGCLQRERTSATQLKHGAHAGKNLHKPTPEYRAWQSMRGRCYNPSDRVYRHYGGRGIEVCQAWRDSFEAFLAEVGARPRGKTSLGRRDNAKGYEPGNVRWETSIQQARNTRRNLLVLWKGRSIILAEACGKAKLPYETVRNRIKRLKWEPAVALTTPVRTPRAAEEMADG